MLGGKAFLRAWTMIGQKACPSDSWTAPPTAGRNDATTDLRAAKAPKMVGRKALSMASTTAPPRIAGWNDARRALQRFQMTDLTA
jgi:hypothetical protein